VPLEELQCAKCKTCDPGHGKPGIAGYYCRGAAYWVLGGVLVEPELDGCSLVLPLAAPEVLGALELVLPGVLELPLGVLEDEGAPDEGLVLDEVLAPAADLSLSASVEPAAELEEDEGGVLGVELEPADEDEEPGEDGAAEPLLDVELGGVAEPLDEDAPVSLPLSQP
jgi:hypothetical protein